MTDLHPHIDTPVNDEEIAPPYNRVKAIGDIKKALICPLSWCEVFRIDADASFEPLDLLWQETLEAHVRGAESQYVGAECMLFELDTEEDDELQALWTNVRLWRESARNEFCAKLRRFTDLRYASREEYGKHLPPLGSSLPPDRIDADARRRGESIFYRDIPPEEALTAFLNAVWWSFSDDFMTAAEQKLLDRLLYEDNVRICFRCTGLIGSSKGEPTAFVCFELDATTPIVHAYPVSEAEARQINDGHIQAISALQAWELH
jgi:hypothetical protein